MMEFVLTHDGKKWQVKNAFLSLSASSLRKLDERLGTVMREMGMIKKGEKARVFMGFDNSTIPQWIRQYSQHYFNRVVEIEGA